MPMANVEVGWEVAADRGVPHDRAARARPSRGRSSGTASTSRRRASNRAREYCYRFHCGQRGQPDRPDQDRPAGGRRGRSAALRGVRLQPLRDRILHRVPAHRRRAVRFRLPHRRLHLRRARRRRQDRAVVRQHRGDEIYTVVDYRNRYAQYKLDPRPARRARLGAVHRHLGRSRGRQRLRRRCRRARHAAGDLPAAARRGVPGLLRDDAAAAVDDAARPAMRLYRGCSSATSSTSACSIRGSSDRTRRATA